MKSEFSAKPEKITDQWPGELQMFSWQDFVTAIPTTLFLVTGWKSNGKENACLQSWSTFLGDQGEFLCILGSVGMGGHMYKSLKETGCCVLNFPSRDAYDRCVKTIENNQFEADEITVSGLTAEPGVHVNAPRVKECFLNIECEFLWEREHFEGSGNTVVALKAVHVAMDDDHSDQNKLGRYGKTGYLYNINAPRNPSTGEATPEAIGVIEVIE